MEPTDKPTKALPYNTGKVLIGSRYTPPPQNNLLSKDAYDLQTALLSPPAPGPRRVVRALSNLFRGAHHD
jgi:hypothetical protein